MGRGQGLTFLDAAYLSKDPVYDAHQLLLLLWRHLGDVVHHCSNAVRQTVLLLHWRSFTILEVRLCIFCLS